MRRGNVPIIWSSKGKFIDFLQVPNKHTLVIQMLLQDHWPWILKCTSGFEKPRREPHASSANLLFLGCVRVCCVCVLQNAIIAILLDFLLEMIIPCNWPVITMTLSEFKLYWLTRCLYSQQLAALYLKVAWPPHRNERSLWCHSSTISAFLQHINKLFYGMLPWGRSFVCGFDVIWGVVSDLKEGGCAKMHIITWPSSCISWEVISRSLIMNPCWPYRALSGFNSVLL